MKKILWTIGLCLVILGCAYSKEKYVGVIDEALPKTVKIVSIHISTTGWVSASFGSGVFISPNGHVLTCAHLFRENRAGISVELYDGDIHGAEVIKIQEHRDLALLRIYRDDTPFMMLEDPRDVKVGQEVLVIGHPFGLDWTATNGIVSAMYRDLGIGYNMVQTNADINPGNSGGPLFNLKGELVGINSGLVSPIRGFIGLGFAVSNAQILELLGEYRDIAAAVKTWE